MIFARSNRALVALLLYSCVLFSSFACALGHGQTSGLRLSGIDQLTCNTGESNGPQTPAQSNASPSYDCPVCSGVALAPVSQQGWAIALPDGKPLTISEPLYQPLPSAASWPDASPRAPPLLQA
jgi:hypothetical protein